MKMSDKKIKSSGTKTTSTTITKHDKRSECAHRRKDRYEEIGRAVPRHKKQGLPKDKGNTEELLVTPPMGFRH